MLLKRLVLKRPHLYDDYPTKIQSDINFTSESIPHLSQVKNYHWILVPLLLIPLFGLIILSVVVSNENLAAKPLISPEAKSTGEFTPGVGGGP